MGAKKRPTTESSDEASGSIKHLRGQGTATETIDLDALSSSQMTLSGSFDLRSVRTTSLAKLLTALPMPALLIDSSQMIIFSNNLSGNPADQSRDLEGLPLSSIFTELEEAMKFDTLIETVFSQRKPAVSNATLDLGKGPILARTHMRSVRVGTTRFVLLMIQDLTLERQQLLLTKKHEQELLKARNDLEKTVLERTAELKHANELLNREVGIRRQAEEQLRKSHSQLEHLVEERTAALKATNARLLQAKSEWERTFDAVPDLIFILDAQHRIIRANAVVLNRLGLNWSEVIGARCYEIMHGLTEPPSFCPHAKLLADGRPHSDEVFEERFNAIIEVTVSPLRDKTGALSGSVHVARDITQRKQTEYALIESEKRYRELVERASDVLYQTDTNGFFTLCNPATSRITGYSEKELLGKHYVELVHPDYKKAVERFYGLQFVKKIPETDYEFAILTKDGQTVWLAQRVQLLMEGQDVVGFQSICRDITELKKAQIALQESEKRYRELVERAGDIIYQTDANGFFTVCNPVAARITGYSQEELIGKHFLELIHPEYKKPAERFYGLQFVKKIPETYYEFSAVSKQGETMWFAQRVQLLTKEEEVVGFQAICRDITELKRARIALEESERRYRQLVELSPVGIYVRVDQECVFANQAMVGILGVERSDDLVGKQVIDFYHPDCHEAVRQRQEKLLKTDDPLPPIELKLIRFDGSTVDVEVTAAALPHQGQRTYQVVVHDITDRKRAEEALRKSEERLELALKGADLGLWDYNLQTREAYFSRRRAEMVGYSLEEARPNMSWWGEKVHPEDVSRVLEAFNAHAEGRSPLYECDHRIRHKSGEYIWTAARGKIVERDKQGNPLRIVGTSLDITDRKRGEEALRKSEEQYRMLVETMGETVASIDENGTVKFVNNRFCEISGYSREEIIGRSLWDFPTQVDLEVVREQMELRRQGIGGSYETVLTTKHGEEKHVIVSSEPVFAADGTFKGSFMVITDITERKHMEERLKGSLQEKEVLLKEIHHRVKNNLQIISSLLQLQSFHLEDKSPEGVLEDLESRIRAIAAVHEKLYQSESLMRIDVNEYLQDLAEHLFYSYGPSTGGIGLIIDIKDISCGIDTAVPLGLIVSELVSNSLKHAFPDGRRGSITISLRSVLGEELELTVSDNGVGMARDWGAVGSETLGLSLVKSLADQLHADIQLDRTQGTHYSLRFKEVEKPRR